MWRWSVFVKHVMHPGADAFVTKMQNPGRGMGEATKTLATKTLQWRGGVWLHSVREDRLS